MELQAGTKGVFATGAGTLTRRNLIKASAATLAATALADLRALADEQQTEGLRVRFLGTGASDWSKPDPKRGYRRLTSALLDGRVLIDFTQTAIDMLPVGCRPEAVFYTHSHGDHYRPHAALAVGVKRVYCHASWAEDCRKEYEGTAARMKLEPPVVRGLQFGERVDECGLAITSLPANHGFGHVGEHPSIYLVEKGPTRLIYATDTAGIPADAARIAGIDAHWSPGRPITALIMEATSGDPDDWRLFAHSSIATVAQIVRVLTATKRYVPRLPGQKVYLTHLARTLHGSQEEIAARAPAPLAPAYDGLEIVL